jgi:hypothetical protein
MNLVRSNPIKGWPERTKLVRLGFCDAAGLSSIQQEPFAVHSVVIIEGDHLWHEVDADVQAILDTLPLSPAEKLKFEFHAGELFQGDEDLHLDRSERQRVQKAFLELIPKHSLPFVSGGVDKVHAEQTVKPYSFERLGMTYEDVSFLFAIERLELWFRREQIDEKALLISDESNVAHLLEECVRTYRNRPLPYPTLDLKFDHVVALPLFTASHKSGASNSRIMRVTF